MKSPIYVLVTGAFIVLTAHAAGKLRVPRVKTVSVFNHPVIAQTAPEFVEKRGRTTILRRFYIAKWGLHRYEYGYAQYYCDTKKCDQVPDTTALRMYESCKGFKKNGQPNCQRVVSARVDINDPANDVGAGDRTWYSCEEDPSNCSDRNTNNELEEYPGHNPGSRDSENPWGYF